MCCKRSPVFAVINISTVAKYCDEYVCLCVCLVSEDISRTTRAIFTKFLVHIAYVRGSVLLRYKFAVLTALRGGLP